MRNKQSKIIHKQINKVNIQVNCKVALVEHFNKI
jgi:hypothetical protein